MNSENRAFIRNIFEKGGKFSHTGVARIYLNPSGFEICGLLDILNVSKSQLTVDGQKIIDYLETELKDEDGMPTFEAFKWKLYAFYSLQDALNLPMYPGANRNNIFNAHYFYYESRYIISECIVSSLNGLHVANRQLLRNFIEFNLMQLYFVNKIHKAGSFQPLNEFFSKRHAPSNTKLIGSAIPDDIFCKPIKKRIQLELSSLSERYSHAYLPQDSPKHIGIFQPESSIDTIFFWIHVSFVLDMVLWMYYVNIPMLFSPVDILKKFGFSPPLNMFVDTQTNYIVKKSLGGVDYELFKEYAKNNSLKDDFLDFYNSQPDLTEEEIWQTYNDDREENDTLHTCYLKTIAKIRVSSEVLSVQTSEKPNRTTVDFNMENIPFTFSDWREVYRSVG